MIRRFLPDLLGYDLGALRFDATAALVVTVMSVPQGIAYAMIAGLDPAIGLYAGAVPTILGSLLRSSSHVVTGPTNALSLLVGTAVAASASGGDPTTAALVLALMVGTFQLAAGLLKLGAIVDYISSSVVTGYISGAGVLIGIGQLKNLTGTAGARGDVYTQVSSWVAGLGDTHVISVAIGLGTAALILALRRLPGRLPVAAIVLGLAVVAAWLFGLDELGVRLARDIAPVPAGLPPLHVPSLSDFSLDLVPIAVAATVLSLVESSSVARSIASRTGQRLISDQEFVGQGAANLAAGFFGGYPTSGSLSRSALNERAGARTRIGGVLAGLMMIGVLLVAGPLVDWTPIPALAGLLLIVAADLVDLKKIRAILAGDLGDKLAFVATLIGTWVLSLDLAIYLGVGISLVLFLRRARQIVVRELVMDGPRFRDIAPEDVIERPHPGVRILHIEGSLFFGAASELTDALDQATIDPAVQVLIVRLKRTRGLDYTTATVFGAAHARLAAEGRHLFLVGLRPDAMRLLERVGVADELGRERLYPTQPGWFAAMDDAISDALAIAGTEEAHEDLTAYVEERNAG